jgi:hypothetical protein
MGVDGVLLTGVPVSQITTRGLGNVFSGEELIETLTVLGHRV